MTEKCVEKFEMVEKILIKKKTKKYSRVEVENQEEFIIRIGKRRYSSPVEVIGESGTKRRYIGLDGIGHFCLEQDYFVVKTDDCQICSDEYEERFRTLRAVCEKVRELEGLVLSQ